MQTRGRYLSNQAAVLYHIWIYRCRSLHVDDLASAEEPRGYWPCAIPVILSYLEFFCSIHALSS
jgi:hypothetical protein